MWFGSASHWTLPSTSVMMYLYSMTMPGVNVTMPDQTLPVPLFRPIPRLEPQLLSCVAEPTIWTKLSPSVGAPDSAKVTPTAVMQAPQALLVAVRFWTALVLVAVLVLVVVTTFTALAGLVALEALVLVDLVLAALLALVTVDVVLAVVLAEEVEVDLAEEVEVDLAEEVEVDLVEVEVDLTEDVEVDLVLVEEALVDEVVAPAAAPAEALDVAAAAIALELVEGLELETEEADELLVVCGLRIETRLVVLEAAGELEELAE